MPREASVSGLEASRGTSTRTNDSDRVQGGRDAEKIVSGFRARPQGGCVISGPSTPLPRDARRQIELTEFPDDLHEIVACRSE